MSEKCGGNGPFESGAATLAENLAAAAAALWRGDAAAMLAGAQTAGRQAQAGGTALQWLPHAYAWEALACLMLSNYPAAFERALEALALLDEQPPNGQQVALRARALNTCLCCSSSSSRSIPPPARCSSSRLHPVLRDRPGDGWRTDTRRGAIGRTRLSAAPEGRAIQRDSREIVTAQIGNREDSLAHRALPQKLVARHGRLVVV